MPQPERPRPAFAGRRGAAALVWIGYLGLAIGPAFAQPEPADASAATAVSRPAPGRLVLTRLDGAGASDLVLVFDLANGSGRAIDRLRRNPLRLRARPLGENLFSVIGRPVDPPPIPGEILMAPLYEANGSIRSALFIETGNGYTAFFDNPGKGLGLGEITTTIGRPFAPLAAADGNFVLLPRRDASGRTQSACLYHGTTGRGLCLADVGRQPTAPQASPTPELPVLAGPLSAVPIQAGNEETTSFLIVDGATGAVSFLDVDPAAPARLRARSTDLDLWAALSRTDGAGRITAVGLLRGSNRTGQVLLVDPESGAMAVLDNADNRGRPGPLRPLRATLAGSLPPVPGGASRHLAAAPDITLDRTTLGVWLFDGQSRAVVYVSAPGNPADATVSVANLGG